MEEALQRRKTWCFHPEPVILLPLQRRREQQQQQRARFLRRSLPRQMRRYVRLGDDHVKGRTERHYRLPDRVGARVHMTDRSQAATVPPGMLSMVLGRTAFRYLDVLCFNFMPA